MPLQKLKICFIAGTLGVGGAERQLYFILRSLKKSGAEVSLICLNSGEFWEQPIKELGIAYYSLHGEGNKISRVFKIISILKKIKPALVQSQHFYTNLYAAVGAMFCGAKSIGASRNELKIEISSNGRFGNASFKLPNYFIANSQQSVDQAIELGKDKDKVFYLSNAIDTSKFLRTDEDRAAKREIILLAMGRLTEQKRFDRFITLIASLKAQYGSRIKGQIIGSGKLENELREMAKNQHLDHNDLEFVLHTPNPEKYMKQAGIFVLTSDFEGTPNVVLEAMASSLPVIMTKVGNLQYFVKEGENGFFFDGNDGQQLLDIAKSLIDDKEKMESVSQNARETVSDLFSLERLDKKLIYIYNTIGQD